MSYIVGEKEIKKGDIVHIVGNAIFKVFDVNRTMPAGKAGDDLLWGDYVEYNFLLGTFDKSLIKKRVQCECGGEKYGGGTHSWWCPVQELIQEIG